MTERDDSFRNRGDWGADPELRAMLRSVDPARSLPPRLADDVARLVSTTIAADAADLGERDIRVAAGDQVGGRRASHRTRLPLLVAAAAVVAVAGVGSWVGADRSPRESGPVAGDAVTPAAPRTSDPATTTAPGAPSSSGAASLPTVLQVPVSAPVRCMPPNVGVLELQQVAFEGSVTSIADGVVTLTPSTVYVGDVADTVQVQAPGPDMTALLNAVQFEVGKDYLVSASDGQVTLCGFSAETSPELRTLYQQAFDG